MEGRRRVPRVLPALLSRLSHSLLGQLSSSSSEDRPERREKHGVSVVFIFLSEDNPEIRLIQVSKARKLGKHDVFSTE